MARKVKITREAKGYYRWIPREAAEQLDDVDADRLTRRAHEDLAPDPYIVGPGTGYHTPLPRSPLEGPPADLFEGWPVDDDRRVRGYSPGLYTQARPSAYPTVCNAHTMWPNDPWRCEIHNL